ncbi:unnamed protein product [Callosobruchus maculatus]|uniref:Uncharacterized protein n=1 Tax=Callosobruchus maculatus TaxID=64391 RepID=A0A653DVR7_CALMS|nr:unnamed protein product [Callosobruchus maculatus]
MSLRNPSYQSSRRQSAIPESCCLQSKYEDRKFPRWLSYLSVYCCLCRYFRDDARAKLICKGNSNVIRAQRK